MDRSPSPLSSLRTRSQLVPVNIRPTQTRPTATNQQSTATSTSGPNPKLFAADIRRKSRPSTAMQLSCTETINAMMGIPQNIPHQQKNSQSRPESAQPTVGRRTSYVGNIAPLKSATASPTVNRSSAWGSPSSVSSVGTLTARCSGCGGFAEMCLSCFTQFKRQDGAQYKLQLVQAVDSLFEKATNRAFSRMAVVVLQWVFHSWRAAVRRNKWKSQLATRLFKQQQLRRLWKTWQVFIYKRRIVGAMLYAETQQRETTEKKREVAKLHGDGFERESAARVHEALQREEVQTLEKQLAALRKSMLAKDRELLQLRRELKEARVIATSLQSLAVDPQELDRLRVESTEYKKASFQLVAALTQSMETQLEVLSTSEGRQNLNDIFMKELLHAMDKPENGAFYNPLVEMETGSTDANELGEGGPPSIMMAYEAPMDRADGILTQWVNSLVEQQPPDWLSVPRMQNFHSSLNDGKVFAVVTKLLHAAMCRTRLRRPTGTTASRLEATSVLRENGEDLTEISMERYLDHVRKETNVSKRLELMISTLGQAMWLPLGLFNAKDIRAGNPEFNFAALTYLFVTSSPCLAPAYYALCTELKQQLEVVKSKWCELEENKVITAPNPTPEPDPTTGEEISMSMRVKLALSQTLDLKRRIDLEDIKSREGHALWIKAQRIVMRKCFLSYARLARGKVGVLTKLTSRSMDENEAFAKIPVAKLQDLALPYEDFNWETKLLQSYLVTIYCDLARIYRGYATRTGVINETINVGEFTELLTECHVLEGNLSPADVSVVIRAIDPKSKTVNTHRALPPLEFLEALVRIGRKKYPVETKRVTISESFCLFVDNFILPFAFRSDADMFRQQIENPSIRSLLIKYAEDLRAIYAKYAVEDVKQKLKMERVTAFTFGQLLLDRGVLDMTLTTDKVLGILSKVLRNASAPAPAANTEESPPVSKVAGRAGEDDDISYPQFEESLIAVACYKFPDPYTSLESRVEKFFSVYIRER